MSLSDKSIQEFKNIFEKEYGRKLSDAEAREEAENLVGLSEIFMKHAQTEERRKKRLKNNPDGFFHDANEYPYDCGICGEQKYGNEIWWNLDGLRCSDCWRHIKEAVIPSLKHRYDNERVWFQDWQIHSDFGIHPSTVHKLRRKGILHGIDLKREDGTIYYTVYLANESKKFINKYKKNESKKKI